MTYWIGIDGGGSHLRAAIVSFELNMIAQVQLGTANPGIVGHEESASRIHHALQSVIHQANLSPDDITGVGIGIAGASADHSEAWLREVLSQQLPQALIVPGSDCEIALVGAHGKRCGILVLAGTGSIAYGINREGEAARVGGWGYLLGDEGSGFRMGLNALQAVTRAADGRGESTQLTGLVLHELELAQPQDLIGWLYKSDRPRNTAIAELAPLVLEAAKSDSVSLQIVESAAHDLHIMYQALIDSLSAENLPIGFAGGLLTSVNLLSTRLCELLGLSGIPTSKYSPVIGAALLAQIRSRETIC